MNVAIIGAGPAGITAGICLARKNINVTIYERNSKIGKKLALSGNGKCNLYNELISDLDKYHSSNNEFLSSIINKCNIDNYMKFLDSIGLVRINRNGYYYPYSEKAISVISCLINNYKGKIIYESKVEEVIYKDNKFIINNNIYDKLIIATGGVSYPNTGSDGEGFELAKSLGHTITKLEPSLGRLFTSMGIESIWMGVRAHVKVTFNDYTEEGEVQFTENGLSGICIYNLCSRVSINDTITIDLIPWTDKLNIKDTCLTISEVCDGFLNYKLTKAILKYLKLEDIPWNKLSDLDKNRFINTLKNFKIKIIDKEDIEYVQVTKGGIPLNEVNINTLESRVVPNLYFAGEVLDLDGDCGGYNLTIAFITGLICGGINDKN